MNKRIRKICLIFIILYSLFCLFSTKSLARNIDSNIDGIDDNLYPGIKSQIKELQAKHPNWKFKVEYTDLTWEEVINGEHQGHSTGTSPSNLVPVSSSYSGLWICEICGKQKYDTGRWYCASTEALEYMMDPRNSLNDSDIFQFMQLSGFEDFNNDIVRNTLKSMSKDRPIIDDECINAVIQAANESHVDPYYIMAKILEEQSATSPLYTGAGVTDSQGNIMYRGYYNLFNIGATATSGNRTDVLINGLIFAANQGWTSKTASILGGVKIIAQNYISKEQDTLYYQKYDVIGNDKYSHQYQQNILGAQTAGSNLKKLYSKYDSSLSGNYSFIIPLYKNIPVTKSPRPAVNKEHNLSSGIKMGDVNCDGQINFLDIVAIVNHIRGKRILSGNGLIAARLSGESNLSFKDIVIIVNVIRGKIVLPSGTIQTATIKTSSSVRLSPNGTEFGKISNGDVVKILKTAESPVNGVYWDLITSSKGVYGYIPRSSY